MSKKIKYKAFYFVAGQNPFRGNRINYKTKTVEIDADVPFAEVQRMAEEAKESYVFDRVERI